MIAGIGNDIVEVKRIRDLIDRYGHSFLDRVFTDHEQIEGAQRSRSEIYYAGRWAAKEALSKALGCGIGGRCGWLDINIANVTSGQPELTLTGAAAAYAKTRGIGRILVSISHEGAYASSFVLLEEA